MMAKNVANILEFAVNSNYLSNRLFFRLSAARKLLFTISKTDRNPRAKILSGRNASYIYALLTYFNKCVIILP